MEPTSGVSVAEATATLKVAQGALTDLRRQHLEGEYVPAAEVRGLVAILGSEIRSIMKEFPVKLRRRFPTIVTVEAEREIFDFYSTHVCEATDALIAKLDIKPRRGGTSAYTTRPAPKPKSQEA